jgi:GNAT superfamily N-acetyltransferase
MKATFMKAVLPNDKARLVAFDREVFKRADWFAPDDWDAYESYWMIVSGKRVGCCAFEPNAAFEDHPEKGVRLRRNSVYIATTGILPEFRGKRLGEKFKRWQVAWARRHGFTRMVTNCRKSNQAIIRLNQKFGFRVLRTTARNYYHSPAEPAVVMELKLATEEPHLNGGTRARSGNRTRSSSTSVKSRS